MKHLRRMRAGDWVEVRGKDEILATLDKNGRLEGMPFMPQMFQYCGQRLQVYKRAHKTCDTVNGTGGRRVANAVHLTTRCDGRAYGGCPANCLLFWKEAWLKPLKDANQTPDFMRRVKQVWCTEEDVQNATTVLDHSTDELRYSCQATQLPFYSSPLLWRDPSQYFEDLTSRNTSVRQMLSGFFYYFFSKLIESGGRLGAAVHTIYDGYQRLTGGVPYPCRPGGLPAGTPTPSQSLDLQPGEMVKVKSYEEILATVDPMRNNKALSFDPEMVPYCGRTLSVGARISWFIDESTGKVRTLKVPAVLLEGATCQACYSKNRMMCPRGLNPWWREVWLERVDSPASGDAGATGQVPLR